MNPQAAGSAYLQYFALVDRPNDPPVSPFVLIEVVDVYVHSREWSHALNLLQSIVQEFPEFMQYKNAVWMVGMVLLHLQQYTECLECLEICQSEPPSQVPVWEVMMVIARVTELMKEPDPQHYEAALAARKDQQNNDFARTCLSLANTFARRREFVFALTLLEKFFELKGGMAAFLAHRRTRILQQRRPPSSRAALAEQWGIFAECYIVVRDDLSTVCSSSLPDHVLVVYVIAFL